MNILALDPANITGWALAEDDQTTGGIWDLDGKAIMGYRLDRLLGLMTIAADRSGGLDLIAYENASYGAKFASGQAYANKLNAIIEVVAFRYSAGQVTYAPSSIKKFATGDGTATKDNMKKACELRLSVIPLDDNEADARFILEMARQGIPGLAHKKKQKRRRKQSAAKERKLF